MAASDWQGISGQLAPRHAGAPRLDVDRDNWLAAASALSSGRFSLAGLWGDDGTVHMAVHIQDEPGEMAVLSLACPDGAFPSVGRLHAPAIRLERTIRDLFGLVPEDAPDLRPWLDHGRWGVRHPLGRAGPAAADGDDYTFLPAEGVYMTAIIDEATQSSRNDSLTKRAGHRPRLSGILQRSGNIRSRRRCLVERPAMRKAFVPNSGELLWRSGHTCHFWQQSRSRQR